MEFLKLFNALLELRLLATNVLIDILPLNVISDGEFVVDPITR